MNKIDREIKVAIKNWLEFKSVEKEMKEFLQNDFLFGLIKYRPEKLIKKFKKEQEPLKITDFL